MSEEGLRASVEKMRGEGVADAAIRAFEHYYRQLEEGETGLIPEDSIEPVTDVTDLDDLADDADEQREALQHAIVLRLNGGQFEGKPFILQPSQAFIAGSIFGWKRTNDEGKVVRRFRRAGRKGFLLGFAV